MNRLLIACALGVLGPACHAITIQMDYSLDTTGFFAGNTTARNAVDAAAADLSALILPSLGAVASDSFAGSAGGATATFDWSFTYRHPVTNAMITVPTFSLAADTITIYAGMRVLSGPTLGEGGPGGAGVSVGVSGPPAQFQNAINVAQANSNAVMPREAGGGSGPIMGTLSGAVGSSSYSVSYGPLAGNLWFDNDTDNNGSVDSAATLAASWHFDHTTAVAAGKNDLYSVALHEILHAVGIGTADTWDGLHLGTTWNGAQAQALNGGSGLNLLSGDESHLREGLMSVRFSDGQSQEVAMDPSITVGTRKSLTQMDAAFLRDLGYQTVPEPSSALLLALSGLTLAGKRRRATAAE